jgi:hypothetical protein
MNNERVRMGSRAASSSVPMFSIKQGFPNRTQVSMTRKRSLSVIFAIERPIGLH